jgi:hypothetical protein
MSLIRSRSRVVAFAACIGLLYACGGDKGDDSTVSLGTDNDAGSHPRDAGKDAATDAQVNPTGGGAGDSAGSGGGGGNGGTSAGAGGGGGTDQGGGGGGHTSAGCDAKKCSAMADDCNSASCDTKTDTCKLTPKKDGTLCGDHTIDECTGRDTCKAGVCESHDVAKGTPCGDQDTQCHLDDACDGKGKCKDKGFLPVGTPCGDQDTDTECDAPDSCSSAGVCLKNYAAADAPCGDQDTACRYDDSCDGQGSCTDHGVWTLGACPPGSKNEADGCLCGNEILNVCQFAVDVCIDGTCMYGREDDGTPCGDTVTDDECDKPDSCLAGFCSPRYVADGTACGNHSSSTCDQADTCDGAGSCDPRYADATTSCASASDCQDESLCNGSGLCTPGAYATAGTQCGSQSDSECDDPNTCDAAGVCENNYVAIGSACGDQGLKCVNNDSCNATGACTDHGIASPCAITGYVVPDSGSEAGMLAEVYGNASLVTATDQDGAFVLSLPLMQQLMMHFGDGSASWGLIEPRTLTIQDVQEPLYFYPTPDSAIDGVGSAVGITVNETKGAVFVTIEGSSVVGTEGATLSAAAAAPVTRVGDDYQLSSTIKTSGLGYLLFFNVTVGTTTVSPIKPSGETCTVDAGGSTQFPVLAHTVTEVHISCH